MTNKKNSFSSEVEKAFTNNQYPQNARLVHAFIGHYGDLVSKAFSGKHWKDLEQDDILAYADELHMFTDEAFVYFLPAFLLDINTKNAGIQPSIYYQLIPPVESEKKIFFDQRMKLFTLSQRKVILRFIKHFLQENIDIQKTHRGAETQKYWEQMIEGTN